MRCRSVKSMSGWVATFQKRQESDWSSRPGSVSCRHPEQVVDELNLSPHIRTAHPPRLPVWCNKAAETKVKQLGRRRWKKASGYHRQGRVENTFFRYKSIIGDGLRARSPAGQGSEVVLGCEILNRMTALGRPVSYRIGRRGSCRWASCGPVRIRATTPLITASPVIPIGVPPLVVRSVQHTVGRSARQTVITARPASAGAGHRTAEYRRNNAPVLRRYSAVATSTGPPQDTNPAPPRPPPHPLASGQVVRSAQCGPLALIVEGTRRRRRASTTVRSGRSGQITSSGTNAQRGRPESGHLSGTRPRVQPRLARCPPRALTRWCVARGEGAARCAGRRCGPGGAARHAGSPVRAVPDTPRAGPRPRAVPAR